MTCVGESKLGIQNHPEEGIASQGFFSRHLTASMVEIHVTPIRILCGLWEYWRHNLPSCFLHIFHHTRIPRWALPPSCNSRLSCIPFTFAVFHSLCHVDYQYNRFSQDDRRFYKELNILDIFLYLYAIIQDNWRT